MAPNRRSDAETDRDTCFEGAFVTARAGRSGVRGRTAPGDDWEYGGEGRPTRSTADRTRSAAAAGRGPHRDRGLFTLLFFAGASFTAGAGDQAAQLLEEDAAQSRQRARTGGGRLGEHAGPAAEPAAPEQPRRPNPLPYPRPAAAEAAPTPEPAPTPSRPRRRTRPATEPAETPQPEPPHPPRTPSRKPRRAAERSRPGARTPHPPRSRRRRPSSGSPLRRRSPRQAVGEAPARHVGEALGRQARRAHPCSRAGDRARRAGEPTIWLNRALPDPTPASARLTRPLRAAARVRLRPPRRGLGRGARRPARAGRPQLGAGHRRGAGVLAAGSPARTRGRPRSRSRAARVSPTARPRWPTCTARSGSSPS